MILPPPPPPTHPPPGWLIAHGAASQVMTQATKSAFTAQVAAAAQREGAAAAQDSLDSCATAPPRGSPLTGKRPCLIATRADVAEMLRQVMRLSSAAAACACPPAGDRSHRVSS